ncbi:MAG TPA: hypothetical protein VNC78_11855 [Actinomycetota bacterium]|nr:hypothetical protein [Actinomycetota bacterium]
MTFGDDLVAALRAWRAAPLLPLIYVGICLAPYAPFPPMWSLTAPAVLLFWVGWVGTERIWYLRLFRGKELPAAEALAMTWQFLGRYLLLALITGVPAAALYALGIWAAGGFGSDPRPTEPPVMAAGLLAVLLVGFALTFIAPALAFTTRQIRAAGRIGFRMLSEGWPRTFSYALIPSIALAFVTYAPSLLAPDSLAYQLPGVVVMALLSTLFRGGIAAYYLRYMEVGDEGAAYAPSELSRAERAVPIATDDSPRRVTL